MEDQGEAFSARHKGLLFGSAFAVAGLLLTLAVLSLQMDQMADRELDPSSNWIGTVGHLVARVLVLGVGNAAFLAGFGFLGLGLAALVREQMAEPHIRTIAVGLVVVAASVLLFHASDPSDERTWARGGLVGRGLGTALSWGLGSAGSLILSLVTLSMGLVLSMDLSVNRELLSAIGKRISALFSVAHPSAAQMPLPGEPSMKPWIERKLENENGKNPPSAPQEPERFEQAPVMYPASSSMSGLSEALTSLRTRLSRRPGTGPGVPAAAEAERFHGSFNVDQSRFVFHNAARIPVTPVRESAPLPMSGRLLSPLNVRILETPGARPAPVDRLAVVERSTPGEMAGVLTAPQVHTRFDADDEVLPDDLHAQESEDLEEIEAMDAPLGEEADSLDSPEFLDSAVSGADLIEEPSLDDLSDADEADFQSDLSAPALPAATARTVPALVPTEVPPVRVRGRYALSLDILNMRDRTIQDDSPKEIESTRQRLEQVMRDYGIQAQVVEHQRGPIITLFEVRLEPGVRVGKILSISDEIKMHLEASSVRIIAPIPGKSTIGIEIPNRRRESVLLGDIARRDPAFFSQTRELSIVLGKDISGANAYVDLARLPHLLIAGATGAGKSVYMNAIIASLLYTHSPQDLRLIMIDPKMVELKLYEGIPHLLMPVITDVRQAGAALQWVVDEMERRYAVLSRLKSRDIRSYNERIQPGLFENGEELKRMPYLLLFIDELSDLMMVSARDVEESIIRLTQKARAVGIHVVMATQRPSVDVITALIKANCPARIAFHVAQKTDSRTILDAQGAEALLDRGDMLYKSPTAAGLTRIQAPLITEEEIERIVAETRRFGEPVYVELPSMDSGGGGEDGGEIDEELFGQAWDVVKETGRATTSYIQRRLRIGYNRAATIMEMMEERGYVSRAVGSSGKREILKTS